MYKFTTRDGSGAASQRSWGPPGYTQNTQRREDTRPGGQREFCTTVKMGVAGQGPTWPNAAQGCSPSKDTSCSPPALMYRGSRRSSVESQMPTPQLLSRKCSRRCKPKGSQEVGLSARRAGSGSCPPCGSGCSTSDKPALTALSRRARGNSPLAGSRELHEAQQPARDTQSCQNKARSQLPPVGDVQEAILVLVVSIHVGHQRGCTGGCKVA